MIRRSFLKLLAALPFAGKIKPSNQDTIAKLQTEIDKRRQMILDILRHTTAPILVYSQTNDPKDYSSADNAGALFDGGVIDKDYILREWGLE